MSWLLGLALHLHNYGADPVPGHVDVHPLHLPDGDDSLPTGHGQLGDGGHLIPSLDQGGDVLTVLDWEEVDFMVKQVEADKCLKVVHINSSLGSVLLVCTLADRRRLDVYTLHQSGLSCVVL